MNEEEEGNLLDFLGIRLHVPKVDGVWEGGNSVKNVKLCNVFVFTYPRGVFTAVRVQPRAYHEPDDQPDRRNRRVRPDAEHVQPWDVREYAWELSLRMRQRLRVRRQFASVYW